MELIKIKKIGQKTIDLLQRINIFTIEDLLTYYPYRYIYWQLSDLNNVSKNEQVIVKAIIETEGKVSFIKKNFNRLTFKANINNLLTNVSIFNRGYLKKNLTIGRMIILVGKYNKEKNTFIASDIRFDKIDNNNIEPVYHLVNGLKNKTLQSLIKTSLEYKNEIVDFIPEYLNTNYRFITKGEAIEYIHQPKNSQDLKLAKLKLIYEELYIFMFKIGILKRKNQQITNNFNRAIDQNKIESFIDNLPFKLTEEQQNAISEIIKDMQSNQKMNRLVLGDVGSGKTVVAITAMYINALSGYQSALMAPTEILATQHYFNLQSILKNANITVELLVGSQTKKEKENLINRLKRREIDILVGTHAMISKNVEFNNLSLVITDEQHRFGVNQRGTLHNKGKEPDVIYLSATPIPRTYALTLYGDMDLSIIKSKPNGRKEIITKVVKEDDIKIVLTKMLDEIKKGYQIYVVSPIIEESEDETLKDVNQLKEKFDTAFNHKINIAILHGKLKNNEKEAIMNDFKEGEIKILISTTVIEVGIDVKNATTIVIFNAERFGLATLHQLRGRVGRNEVEAYCFLIANDDIPRLKVMEQSNDGFYISEKDFEMRGEGDLFGTKQSGDMKFKIADIRKDYRIVLQAKKDAESFINDNYEDGFIKYPHYREIAQEMNLID